MSISGTQDSKSIRRKPSDPQNNRNSSLKTRENTTPKRMSGTQVSMAGNSKRSNIYKKK